MKCVYLDQDGKDLRAKHVLCFDNETLIAYGRIIPPTDDSPWFSFGRICVLESHRNMGIATTLVKKILKSINRDSANENPEIIISAQAYLTKFYGKFGLKPKGDFYDDDGIQHIKMQCALNAIVKISKKNLFTGNPVVVDGDNMDKEIASHEQALTH